MNDLQQYLINKGYSNTLHGTVYQMLSNIRCIAKAVLGKEHKDPASLMFLIERFDAVKKWMTENLSSLSLTKYANTAAITIGSLHVSENEREQWSKKYNALSAEHQTAYNRRKHPEKKIRIRGPRAVEDVVLQHEDIEQPRGLAPEKQTKATPAPTSTPARAARSEEIEMKDTFEELLSRLTQREQTRNDYKRAMVKSLKHITLSDLAKRPDTVFNYILSVNEHEIGTAYSAATAFIKVMTIPEQHRRQLLEQYVNFYDKHLKKRIEQTRESYKRDESRNLGYTYATLRTKVNEIIPTEKNDEYRLLMSLFINTPPRRTNDYTKIHVNIADDKTSNILVWTEHDKYFIFNDWKNVMKTGQQREPIINKRLIDDIQYYLNRHPDQKVLLDHKPSWISSVFQAIKKKYNVPVNVYDLRHMFTTYIDNEDVDEHQKSLLAKSMGTSLEMLHKTYSDKKKRPNTRTTDVDLIIAETNSQQPSVQDETAQERRNRKKRERYSDNIEEERKKRRTRDSKPERKINRWYSDNKKAQKKK